MVQYRVEGCKKEFGYDHCSLEIMKFVYFYYFPTYFYEKISIVRVILVNLQEYFYENKHFLWFYFYIGIIFYYKIFP